MNKQLSEVIKVAEAYQSNTIASTVDADSLFFAPGLERKLCFCVVAEYEDTLITGTLLPAESVTLSLLEATDRAGTASRAVTDRDGNAITTVIAGAVNADQVVLDHAAFAPGDSFVINGVTFTYDALGYDVDDRPLSYVDRDEIVIAVNAHFNEIFAEADGAVATAALFSSANRGQVGITVDDDGIAGGSFVGSTRITGYVDVDASQLDVANGFTHAGINIENGSVAGDADFTCFVVMGDSRYNPAPGPGR